MENSLSKRAAEVIQVDHLDIEVDLSKSIGNHIFDRKTNQFLLDCFGYIASCTLGHNPSCLQMNEASRELQRVASHNPSNSDILTEEYVSFLETFKKIAMGKHFKKAFFVAGGSVAVENALKTAFDWKLKTNREKDIHVHPNELDVVHLKNAFHGRTGYSLSLTNTADPRKFRDFPKFSWTRIDARKWNSETKPQIIETIRAKQDKIACIIIEPIQGEGGDVHFSTEFHQELRSLADEINALLIHDEVQTGVGLTGKFWAHEHYSVVPDVVVFGKKMQVCGIMVNDRVLSVKGNVFEEKSRINSTWGGNLVDFVRSKYFLLEIENKKLVERVSVLGSSFLQALLNVQKNKGKISNVRGLGFMIAFDLNSSETRDRLIAELKKNRVLVLGCGEKSIRLRPSLTFNEADIEEFIEKLSLSLDSL
jgi:L-lysine 6-transaminase